MFLEPLLTVNMFSLASLHSFNPNKSLAAIQQNTFAAAQPSWRTASDNEIGNQSDGGKRDSQGTDILTRAEASRRMPEIPKSSFCAECQDFTGRIEKEPLVPGRENIPSPAHSKFQARSMRLPYGNEYQCWPLSKLKNARACSS